MSDETYAASFLAYAARKLEDHFSQIRRCVSMLSDEQLWFRPNERSNSVGNLLLHLCGNISQWILGSIGGRTIHRDRPAEFAERGPLPRSETIEALEKTLGEVCDEIRRMSDKRLSARIVVQDYQVTPLTAIFHVVEHFAFHTGQIVTTTKWLLDVDLSLYDKLGHRLDGRADTVP